MDAAHNTMKPSAKWPWTRRKAPDLVVVKPTLAYLDILITYAALDVAKWLK